VTAARSATLRSAVSYCTLPARITGSTTLPKIAGLVYRMDGRVDVGDERGRRPPGPPTSLTIEPASSSMANRVLRGSTSTAAIDPGCRYADTP
jgi:hypothetical protein